MSKQEKIIITLLSVSIMLNSISLLSHIIGC